LEIIENLDINQDLLKSDLDQVIHTQNEIHVQITFTQEKLDQMSANVNKIMEFKQKFIVH